MGGSWPGRSCVGTTHHLGGTCQPARLLSAGRPVGCSVGRLEPSGARLWAVEGISLLPELLLSDQQEIRALRFPWGGKSLHRFL